MTLPLVHIGYHKTASTWFQKNVYPFVRSHAYIDRITARNAFLFDHAFSFDADRVRKQLHQHSQHPIILCDEDLSGNFHSAGLYGGWTREIAHRLASVFPQANIVIIIREQKALLASIYRQYIREGGTHRPYRYFHPYSYLPRRGFQPAKVALFSFDHFRYPCLIKLYQDLFGKDKVHVFLYEALRQNVAKFIEYFARRLELELDPETISWNRQNVSLQRYALHLARLANRFTWRDVVDKRYWVPLPGVFQYSHKWIKSLNKRLPLGGTPTAEETLGPSLAREIEHRYQKDNQWLVQQFRLPLKEHGYAL